MKLTKSITAKSTSSFSMLLLAFSAFAIVFQLVPIKPAEAQSRVCRQLTARLDSLSTRQGSSPQYRKYDNAVRQQSVQINRTERLARRQGCSNRLFRNRNPQCRRINNTLERMEDNLENLRRERARHSPNNSGTSLQRRQIINALQRNRCNGEAGRRQASAEREQPRKSRRRTLLEQIFGVRTYNDRDGRTLYEDEEPSTYGGFGNTFRTLCVRETDGYYFPISFSTNREFFERDDQACQAMCPGTRVALYHHLMPGQDSEQMVEYGTEQPYATKPFAFAYRKELNKDNSCRFAKAELAPAINYNNQKNRNGQPASVTRIGIPVFRKDPHISPDDYDSKVANFTSGEAIKYLVTARSPQPEGQIAQDKTGKNIRIVGPAFFPVQ